LFFGLILLIDPLPNLPPRGKNPPRQAGSFAEIAHWAIFKRLALPLGETGKGVKLIYMNDFNMILIAI
jgi:hypothetical protein